MSSRISSVDHIHVSSIIIASTFEIGDSKEIAPFSRVIAVQRQRTLFFTDELDYDDFPIFSERIPQPIIDEPIEIVKKDESPVIRVGSIGILSISTSGVLHIGSTELIHAESRLKHIRHLMYV